MLKKILKYKSLIPKEAYLKIRPYIIVFWLVELVLLFGLSMLATNIVFRKAYDLDCIINYLQYFIQGTFWLIYALFVLRHSYLVHNPANPIKTIWFLKHIFNFLVLLIICYAAELIYLIFFNLNEKTYEQLIPELFNLYLLQFGTFLLKYLFITSLAQTTAYFSYLKNKETEQYKIEKEFSDLKYQYLVAQIKPHFIFNANHAIISLIEQGDTASSSAMLVKLSSFLRNILNFSKRNLILLQEELDNLKNYIEIQSLRFGNVVSYKIECQQDLWSFKVPPLILQPLVENCYNHAFGNNVSGRIEILCFKNNGIVQLVVKDDGCGFIISNKKENIGLDNTKKRLELIYGDKSAVTIHSEIDKGTSVVIKIEDNGGFN